VVVDIEGTTSATSAVHVGLYDYARPRLGTWIADHLDDPEIEAAVTEIRRSGGLAIDTSLDDVTSVLIEWMNADIKAPPLKTVQGQIWAAGFADGELVSQFFDDVAPALRQWHESGIGLAVFSSGSVASQRPWFRHGPVDLSPFIDGYFDTVSAGAKRDPSSYGAIADALGPRWQAAPSELVFLSDIPAELDAAASAGWRTIGVRRPGEPSADLDFDGHAVVASFAEIDLSLALAGSAS
jgi:enolase-phosphatase E1